MGSRSTNLRTKVVALLVSLVALWAFAAWVTVRDGFNLLGVQTLNARVFEPSDPLLLQLQKERRLSLAYLGGTDPAVAKELAAERRRTDEYATQLRDSAQDWRTELPASEHLERRVDGLFVKLEQLTATRAEVDGRRIDRTATLAAYVDIIGGVFSVFDALGGLDDPEIAQDTQALIDLNRARELLSQEDALLSGVLAAGRMTVTEQTRFAQLVGAQRYIAERTVSELSAADRDRYQQMVGGPAYRDLSELENRILRAKGVDGRPPVPAGDWQGAVAPAMEELRGIIIAGGADVVDRATPVAIGVVVRLVLATGLGLLAVIASIIVSITTARTLLRQLERLRQAAFTLANERLPDVVTRLGRGDEVDVAKEAPPLEFGDDEIGQVGKAFNAVQETAIRTAVEQADLRRGVREVFLSLARRTQALVHRQLTLLDTMERREHDAEELEDLFRVDHLATRMRRNAENLIVLSGSTPGRAWRRNVPMVDVVRGAVAEVEDYTRVNVLPLGSVALTGRAVGDVIHLLAELIENGLSFSPPHTSVEVRGQMVGNGFALEIEDRGLGMSEEDLAAANHRIVDQSELNLANAARLGLYVVSRLTERHGVRVQLKESPYGGTTAVVLIPGELVTAEADHPSTSAGVPAVGPNGTATPAGGAAEATQAPVALAEPVVPALPAPRPAPDVDGVTGNGALPTRSRGRSLPAGGATPVDGLPTRARRAVEPALDGPTYPTGLPVAVARPQVEDAPAVTRPQVEDAPAVTRPQVEDAPAVDGTQLDGVQPASPAGGDIATEPVEPPRTESGLPVRVRQASIAPELRADPAATPEVDAVDEAARQPEQVRQRMSSYQTGTRRGRTDAARLLEGAGTRPEGGDDSDVEDQQAT